MPAAPSHASQLAYPAGPSGREDNGFTEFHDADMVGWVLPLYRRYLNQRVPNEEQDIRPRAFLAQAHTAIFACSF